MELESHVGFAGGLRVGGGGATAPYVATLTLEALFHVATRMPADTPDAILNKVHTTIVVSYHVNGSPLFSTENTGYVPRVPPRLALLVFCCQTITGSYFTLLKIRNTNPTSLRSADYM